MTQLRNRGPMNRPRQRSKVALLGALGLALAAACSDEAKPRGQLMIAITSDLSVTKDMDEVRVEVSRADGTVLPNRQIPILPAQPAPFGKPLPGTLAIVPSDAGGEAVHVRVTARHTDATSGEKQARIVREAIVKVPTERVALLRMPLHWLCDGKVEAGEGDTFHSACDEGQTCKAGVCQDADIELNDLPDYEPALVFGGGDAQGKGSQCLDAQGCFAHSEVQTPDPSDCSLPLPHGADSEHLNVALVLPPKSAGHCLDGGNSQNGTCYVPLDSDPEEGFAIQEGRIHLPPAACLRAGLLGVAVSTTCQTKDVSIPVCGPWTGWPASPSETGGAGGSGGSGGSAASSTGGGAGAGKGSSAGNGGTRFDAAGAAGDDGEPPVSCPVVAKAAPSYYYVLVDTSAAMQTALPAIRQVLLQFAAETDSKGVLFGLQLAKAECQADYSTPALDFTALPIDQLPEFEADTLKAVKLDDAMTQTLDTLQAIDTPASRTLVVITGGVDQGCGTTAARVREPVSRALQQQIALQPLLVTGNDPQTLAPGFQVAGAPTPLVVSGTDLQAVVLLKGLEAVRDSVGPCTFVAPTTKGEYSADLVTTDGQSTPLTEVASSAQCGNQPSYYRLGSVVRLCPNTCKAKGTRSLRTDACQSVEVGGSPNGGGGGLGGGGGKAGEGSSGSSGSGGAATCPSPPHAGTTKNLLIDDFEDGDSGIVKTEGRDAYWYTFIDNYGLGTHIIPDPTLTALPSNGQCHSGSFCMKVSGSTAAQNADFTVSPYANLAFDFTSVMPKCAYNASAYQGVRFWAKGNSSIWANFLTTDVETTTYGGTCTTGCSDGFGLHLNLTDTWQQFELPFASLAQLGFGTPTPFAPSRLVSMDIQFPSSTTFQAAFDDFTFY